MLNQYVSIGLLNLTSLFPLVGVVLLLLLPQSPNRDGWAKRVALITSLITFLLSLLIWQKFDGAEAGFQMIEESTWIPELGIKWKLGIDGISLWFVLLSTLLTPLCILASFHSIQKNVRDYMMAFLVLETMMVGMFLSLDLVVFYVFFEGVLIPMFLIIGVWGGTRRIYAAFKFFLYTLLGSVLMLVAIIALYRLSGTTDIAKLKEFDIPAGWQTWLWLAFFASFAVKVPMWPVHTWLPDAHVEAPTAGSVILAGVLLKMGGYGFLRFSLPLFPLASHDFTPLIYTLSAIAVIYTSLVALVQTDMKKLIAYSSIAHMAFVTAAIFAGNQQAIAGSIIQMLSHGLVSAALFLCVGVVYDRLHTREIIRYGGLAENMPRYALIFMFFTMASAGLPATSGFVGEFLILAGVYQSSSWVALLLATGMVLGAAYALYLYRRIIFGKLEKADLLALKDMTLVEKLVFAPLVILALWMGIYPNSFIQPMMASVDLVSKAYLAANGTP